MSNTVFARGAPSGHSIRPNEESPGVCDSDPSARAAFPFLEVSLGIIAVLTYWPLLRTGFADHDSMFTAIAVWTEPRYFDWVRRVAESQGRWHYWLVYALTAIPFISKSFLYYKVTTIAILLVNAACLYYVVRCISDRAFAALTLLAFLLSLQIGGNHSSLAGYFFYLHILMPILAFSLLAFWRYLDSRRVWLLWASVLLFAPAVLFHETIVLYTAAYVLLVFFARVPNPAVSWWKRWIPAAPFVLVSFAFTVSTLVYRHLYPSQYVGNVFELSKFSFVALLETWYRFSVSGLPGYFFFDDRFASVFQHYAPGYTRSGPDLVYVFSHLEGAWLVRAAAFALGGILAIRTGRLSARGALGVAALGLLFVLIPHALMSVSPHYEKFGATGTRIGTQMSYLVNFGVALLLAGMVWFVAKRLSSRRLRPLRIAFTTAIAAAAAFLSIVTDFSNHYGVYMLDMLRQKWVTMDRFSETSVFRDLPDDAVILAPDLWGSVYNPYYHVSNYYGGHLIPEAPTGPSYWTKYLETRRGKRIMIYRTINEIRAYLDQHPGANGQVYYLRYWQDAVFPRQALVIGHIVFPELTADSAQVLASEDFDILARRTAPSAGGVDTVSFERVLIEAPHVSKSADALTIRTPAMDLSKLRFVPRVETTTVLAAFQNPSFETWRDGIPEGWTALRTEVEVSDQARDGRFAIELLPPSGKDAVTIRQYVRDGRALLGRRVHISIDGKTSDKGKLALNFYYTRGGERKGFTATHPGSGWWQALTHEIEIPPDADPASIYCVLLLRPGAREPALVDDLTVRVSD